MYKAFIIYKTKLSQARKQKSLRDKNTYRADQGQVASLTTGRK